MNEATLPPLPYEYDALEPYYDEQTVRLHHDKHHAGYVNGFNVALGKLKELRSSGDTALVKHWERELAFHGAGHVLHTMFWENMRPGKEENKPAGNILKAIEKSLGSWEHFLVQFKAATLAVEGSGWGVLAQDMKGKLSIFAVENHQKGFIPGLTPVLVCDVWEHAYYKKWGPDRKGWVESFLHLINWDDVEKRMKNI